MSKSRYEGVENFRDIGFTRAALVFSSKGDIQIQGRQVTLAEGSQILTFSSAENPLGNVSIEASELVQLKGTNLGASSNNFPVVISNDAFDILNITGQPANITIETKSLIVQDGAQVLTSTFGDADAGDLTVIASESVLIRDNGGLFATAEEFSRGNGGDLSVTTGKLIVENGARISAETFSLGNAGNINLNVNQLIVRDGGQITASSQLGQDSV